MAIINGAEWKVHYEETKTAHRGSNGHLCHSSNSHLWNLVPPLFERTWSNLHMLFQMKSWGFLEGDFSRLNCSIVALVTYALLRQLWLILSFISCYFERSRQPRALLLVKKLLVWSLPSKCHCVNSLKEQMDRIHMGLLWAVFTHSHGDGTFFPHTLK